jgi:hypothetical protein
MAVVYLLTCIDTCPQITHIQHTIIPTLRLIMSYITLFLHCLCALVCGVVVVYAQGPDTSILAECRARTVGAIYNPLVGSQTAWNDTPQGVAYSGVTGTLIAFSAQGANEIMRSPSFARYWMAVGSPFTTSSTGDFGMIGFAAGIFVASFSSGGTKLLMFSADDGLTWQNTTGAAIGSDLPLAITHPTTILSSARVVGENGKIWSLTSAGVLALVTTMSGRLVGVNYFLDRGSAYIAVNGDAPCTTGQCILIDPGTGTWAYEAGAPTAVVATGVSNSAWAGIVKGTVDTAVVFSSAVSVNSIMTSSAHPYSTWTVRTTPCSNGWSSGAYSVHGDMFVVMAATAVTECYGVYSIDEGVTWTALAQIQPAVPVHTTLFHMHLGSYFYGAGQYGYVSGQCETATNDSMTAVQTFTAEQSHTTASDATFIGIAYSPTLRRMWHLNTDADASTNIFYSDNVGSSWAAGSTSAHTYSIIAFFPILPNHRISAFSDTGQCRTSTASTGTLNSNCASAPVANTYTWGLWIDEWQMFVAGGTADSDVTYSADGTTWDAFASMPGTFTAGYFPKAAAWSPTLEKLFVIGRTDSTNHSVAWSSGSTTDEWTETQGPVYDGGAVFGNVQWNTMVWARDRFVALGEKGLAAFSPDGSTWTYVEVWRQACPTAAASAYTTYTSAAYSDSYNIIFTVALRASPAVPFCEAAVSYDMGQTWSYPQMIATNTDLLIKPRVVTWIADRGEFWGAGEQNTAGGSQPSFFHTNAVGSAPCQCQKMVSYNWEPFSTVTGTWNDIAQDPRGDVMVVVGSYHVTTQPNSIMYSTDKGITWVNATESF